jgi:hypothetical protein
MGSKSGSLGFLNAILVLAKPMCASWILIFAHNVKNKPNKNRTTTNAPFSSGLDVRLFWVGVIQSLARV